MIKIILKKKFLSVQNKQLIYFLTSGRIISGFGSMITGKERESGKTVTFTMDEIKSMEGEIKVAIK